MIIDVLTLFPHMFDGVLQESMLRRAAEQKLLTVVFYDIRDYAQNKHRKVDDYPFGGGQGMLLMPQPASDCLEDVLAKANPSRRVVYLSPKGKPFDQAKAKELAKLEELILVCGHYEGIDQRVLDAYVDEEVSLGDFVLTGGEIPAMAVIDAVARLIPGVLGNEQSAEEESFSQGLLEYPQYTRPGEFQGRAVPEVLISGDHGKIAQWRKEQSQQLTKERRPDLWEEYCAQNDPHTKEEKDK